jgi:hypothetical protein
MAGLGGQRHIAEHDLGMARLDLARQRQRRLGGAGRHGLVELRVEPLVELMVPGDQRAGQARHQQKAGHRQARPAVQAHQQRAQPWRARGRGRPPPPQ